MLTAKEIPIVDYVRIEKIGSDVVVKIELVDNDLSLTRYSVELNGQSKVISNNEVIFYDFDEQIETIILKYSYDINDGNGRIDIVNDQLAMKCSLSILMQIVFGQIETIAFGIFQ